MVIDVDSFIRAQTLSLQAMQQNPMRTEVACLTTTPISAAMSTTRHATHRAVSKW
jgi:hypothetical protein